MADMHESPVLVHGFSTFIGRHQPNGFNGLFLHPLGQHVHHNLTLATTVTCTNELHFQYCLVFGLVAASMNGINTRARFARVSDFVSVPYFAFFGWRRAVAVAVAVAVVATATGNGIRVVHQVVNVSARSLGSNNQSQNVTDAT